MGGMIHGDFSEQENVIKKSLINLGHIMVPRDFGNCEERRPPICMWAVLLEKMSIRTLKFRGSQFVSIS